MKVWETCLLLIFLLLVTHFVHGQFRLSGVILNREGNSTLAGVTILEKETNIGTFSSSDGTFELEASGPNATITLMYVGFISKEVQINGRSQITEKLKPANIYCFFDNQKISISTQNGLIENPLGAQIEISSPGLYQDMNIKAGWAYQGNFAEKKHSHAHLSFVRLIRANDLYVSLRGHNRIIHSPENLVATAYAVETTLYNGRSLRFIGNATLILGYSLIDLTNYRTRENRLADGPILGIETWVGKPIYATVIGKATIYKGLTEYQGKISRRFKRINTFVNFYTLDSFTELSVGIGFSFTYLFGNQRMDRKSK